MVRRPEGRTPVEEHGFRAQKNISRLENTYKQRIATMLDAGTGGTFGFPA
jgi:hypothetical protein